MLVIYREILLDALASLGLDRTKFGLHSLRAGGVTAAANHGVCDRLFKKHGRWKSETAKDGYVSENLKAGTHGKVCLISLKP